MRVAKWSEPSHMILFRHVNALLGNFLENAVSTHHYILHIKNFFYSWQFRKYAIKDHNSGQTLKLRLCDTRGLEEDSSVDPQDIVYILDGHVPDRYQVHTLYGLVVAGSKV